MAKKSDDAEQIRLPKQFTKRARMVAAYFEVGLGDWIVDRLTPILERELKEAGVAMGLVPGEDNKPRSKK